MTSTWQMVIRRLAMLAAVSASVAGSLAAAGVAAADHDDVPHAPGDPDRRFELVSPPYKVSGVGAGVPDSPGPEQASGAGSGAYLGERFAVGGHLGAILLDAPFATATDWAFAERVGDQDGWRSRSPVTHAFQESENYRMLQMQAASPAFSTVLWSSNAGELPFFEEMAALDAAGNRPTLVSDWGSPSSPTRWEVVAPTHSSQRIGSVGGVLFPAPAVSADGSHLAVSGAVRGVAGPGDPTLDTVASNAEAAYVVDISAGLSDSFPGAAVRTPAAACTGQDGGPGQSRTRIPVRNADGSLGEAVCAPKAPNRDSRLVSDYGSAFGRFTASTGEIGSSVTNVISRDGSRAFFMAPDVNGLSGFTYPGFSACSTADSGPATKCPAQLYVRQRNDDGEVVTRWISRPEPGRFDGPGQAALLGRAYFEGASADGSKVLFRTDSPLTADDPNGALQTPANPSPGAERGETSWDLYMFELAPGPDGDPGTPDGDPTGAGSKLTRITAGPNGNADCSTQPDAVSVAALRFASQDATRVYFSCSASLGGVADRETGTPAGTQAGTPTTADQTNVYLYDANQTNPADRYTFIARIPRTTFSGGSTNENLTRCASVAAERGASVLSGPTSFQGGAVNCWRGSDDGAFATFWTLGRLTADDPHEFGADASADFYAYDSVSDELTRISAPQGSTDETYPCGSPSAATNCYADPGLVSGVQQSVANPLLGMVSDPAVPAEGRVAFFESASRLVDGDENSVHDVYQWRDGVLSLVSSGASASDGSVYKGNSADGENVYFATRDRLTWQDVDAVLDVYTARIGGGIPAPAPATPCAVLADACHSAVSSPTQPSPESRTPARDGDAVVGVRRRLAIVRPGSRARRRAARTGVLVLGVRVSGPGVVRVGARARIGGRSVRVGGARRRVDKAGRAKVRVRLGGRARRILGRGDVLKLRLTVAQTGALARAAVHLKRGRR
jgi:hypothetical protein